MKYFFSKNAAIIGTGVMACSHYLTIWARMGKPHNNCNVFYCLALGLYAYFRRWPCRSRAYISGAAMGVGFYFVPSAKFAVLFFLILYLVDVVKEKKLRRLEYCLAFLIGYLVVIAPAICHPSTYKMIGVMSGLTFKPSQGGVISHVIAPIFYHTMSLMFAPIYFPWIGEFIFRSIMDCLSAALFALGLCWSLIWAFRRRQFAGLVLTFIVALLLIGGTTPYDYPKTTRAFFVFPWWAAFAGIGAWRLLELGYSFLSDRKGMGFFVWAFILTVLVLNLRQLYVVVPPIYDFIAPESVVLREFQCELRPEVHVYSIGDKDDGIPVDSFENIMRLYGYGSRWHVLKNRTLADPDFSERIVRPALIIVNGRNRCKNAVLTTIRQVFPGCKEKRSVATWGNVSLYMFCIEDEGT